MKKYIFICTFILSLFFLANVSIKTETKLLSTISVEVKGEVENPGVFTLNKDSTLNDLIPKLKLKNTADISNLSLLETLYNKQIVVISKKEDNLNKISINSANLNELCLLPGIGESTALKIIEYRNNNGSFNSLEEIKNINGIGDKKYEKIKEFITL